MINIRKFCIFTCTYFVLYGKFSLQHNEGENHHNGGDSKAESREVSPHADGAGPSGSAGRGDIDGEEGVNISLETDVSMFR